MGEMTLRRAHTELGPQIATRTGLQQQIREVGELAMATDARLSEIQNRGFWKRVFSNNTRDLAMAMRDVVQLQQYTVALVMAGLEVHAGNLIMLDAMRQELDSVHASLGRSAATHGKQAEAVVQLRSTIGSMIAVVSSHAEQLREAERAREMAQSARWGAYAAAAFAGVALLIVLYMFFVRGGGA